MSARSEIELIGFEGPNRPVEVRAEKLSTGVVSVRTTLISEPVRLHWRVGLWDKPPCDVMLDLDGGLVGVQFVLQDERVAIGPGVPIVGYEFCPARPVFNVDSWPTERYWDVKKEVSFRNCEGAFVAVFGSIGPVARYSIDEGLSMFIDADRRLRGFSVGPLGAELWGELDQAYVG